METREVSLKINGEEIELIPFIQDFIDNVISGMMATLQGTVPIKKLVLNIDGEAVTADINGEAVKLNPFVTKIIHNTITGMVSSLRGVGQVDKAEIKIAK